jgi:ribonuclease P protein component
MFGSEKPVTWLTDADSIKSIRRNGRLFRGKSVFAWVSRHKAGVCAAPRVVVVTGRGFSLATQRNLAKRRVRGCIMDLRPHLDEDHNYLIECRKGADKVNYQILVNEVRGILSQASVTEKKKTVS